MSNLPAPHPGESNSRRVLRGFVAMSASSFGVMAIQLGYAAITSRLLPPSAFGAYAVALSGVGLIGMLGGSSLGQSAARRDHDSVHLDRSLVTLALIVGITMTLVAMLLAPFWGQLWGVPESTPATRVLALGIPSTAVASVLAGILRRNGRTSAVAGRTAIGQLTGLAIGLATVLSLRTAWSLGVAAVAGAVVSGALFATSLPRERLTPTRPTSASVEDAVYGAKSAGMNLLRYGTNLIAPWSIGRFAGSDALGGYNRATTMLTLPLEALQRSFSYSLFPELRPGGPASHSGKALTDILILVSWPAIVLGGLGYFAAPPLLALILGPGWEVAISLAGLAVLLGVAPLIAVPLGAAVEALGMFRATLLAWGLGAVSLFAGGVATSRYADPQWAMLGLLGSALILIVVCGAALNRIGRLQVKSWLRSVAPIAWLQVAVSVLLVAAAWWVEDTVLRTALAAVVGTLEVSLLWIFRHRTPFGRAAGHYSLPGFR